MTLISSRGRSAGIITRASTRSLTSVSCEHLLPLPLHARLQRKRLWHCNALLFAFGVRPLTVYNVATFVGFALCGYGAFRLTQTLTNSNGVARRGVLDEFAHLHHMVCLNACTARNLRLVSCFPSPPWPRARLLAARRACFFAALFYRLHKTYYGRMPR